MTADINCPCHKHLLEGEKRNARESLFAANKKANVYVYSQPLLQKKRSIGVEPINFTTYDGIPLGATADYGGRTMIYFRPMELGISAKPNSIFEVELRIGNVCYQYGYSNMWKRSVGQKRSVYLVSITGWHTITPNMDINCRIINHGPDAVKPFVHLMGIGGDVHQ